MIKRCRDTATLWRGGVKTRPSGLLLAFAFSPFFLSLSSFFSVDRFPSASVRPLRFDHRRRTTSVAVLSNFGQSVRDSSVL